MAVAQPVGVYEREDLLTGCQAVAEGIRLANVDVIAAYPIRPYTEVMDAISKIIADGKLVAEYIVADSEHSQFEIVKHAASVGARAFAGSSGTGWMYGFEALVVTATDRLPVLFLVGNRALDDPGAFGVEHNDALAIRDMGWLLCWVATAQEALEHVLLGYRIAEDKHVRMPMALAMDGAFLTHSQHIVRIPSQEAVNRFLPPFDLGERRLHPDNPVSIAPQVNEDWVMEIRRQNWEAARRARRVIATAYEEFNQVFGQRYRPPYYFEEFLTDDAEVVLIGMGTVAMPARTAVRRLREQGHRVGYVNLRWFRPFPTEELRESLRRFRAVGVIDRDFAHGAPDDGGVLLHEVRSCLYPVRERPAVVNFITGLGGRDVSIQDAIRMFEITQEAAREDRLDGFVTWVGVRE
ncbi:MAG: transketolase C-terminal domain-containing protein [Armatimonadota bacterium]|nr:transketolase C-terminal domain-containing protein [Armatimonadota bacterium]MDR5676418.1 transketolase C-terminal domain-containing protein [Armatimonadota bacterium]MDR5689608.1 transketolase C-terminal domain-containing protein [Armatimonadota bacterium]MDR7386996.1 transketolase C-terminal domain-containing protein [Armatimonadota bacterium]MDR7390065.1 transketolase C-terminal domain-containing protein [Armatimonadota bacterium]